MPGSEPVTRAPTDLLSVGEVAARTGVAVSALHFYEREGLISSVRTAGNQRRYARHVLRRIAIIRVAARMGVPLAEVAEELASLPADRMPSRRDWERISEHWRGKLEARRLEIERMERELTGCIGCGCLSLGTCRVFNPGDALSVDGPGPRLLPEIDPKSLDPVAPAAGAPPAA
ncbi:redox-sensitive transcriptional activator SoxR [Leucobacter manosquensis]|uniref:Redox-sensitive transcriptional activator SoxR n=1 Tax=Leucobacter manosquensis TaxID=2810611 RepID=A0ABS5M4Y5_9MICO|nr:redox-sensitive transcriptional activator SoxR [Leucobacter manosquensis]MBS3182258.1 redox-sensitive transcriptional activator SoxR [Leucobacter manosquensis]